MQILLMVCFFLLWWLFALVSRLVGVLWVNKRSLLKIVAVKLWKSADFFFIYFRQNVGLHKKSTRIMLALSTLKRPLSIFSAPLLKNISSKKEYSDGTEKWNKNDCTYNRKCELICHSNNKRDVFLCQRYRMPNAVFISLLIIHGESKWGWTQDNSLFFLV